MGAGVGKKLGRQRVGLSLHRFACMLLSETFGSFVVNERPELNTSLKIRVPVGWLEHLFLMFSIRSHPALLLLY